MTHTEQGVDDMTKHLEASIRAGKSGGVEQEIRMLKQATAADPMQPSAWFNLAMAYKSKGARVEATGAMDRAIFYLLATTEPGACEPPPGVTKAMMEQMMVDFVAKGGELLEEAAHGAPSDLEVKFSLAGRLIELKDRVGGAVPPITRALVHYVYAEVLRKSEEVERALEQYELAAAAARPEACDALALMIIPEMHARLAVKKHAAKSDAQRQGMKRAADAARTGLAEARPFAPSSSDPQLLEFEMTYVRMVNNLVMVSVDDKGALQLDGPAFEELVRHAKEAQPYARKAAKRGGRAGAQAQQLLPTLESIVGAAISMS